MIKEPGLFPFQIDFPKVDNIPDAPTMLSRDIKVCNSTTQLSTYRKYSSKKSFFFYFVQDIWTVLPIDSTREEKSN